MELPFALKELLKFRFTVSIVDTPVPQPYVPVYPVGTIKEIHPGRWDDFTSSFNVIGMPPTRRFYDNPCHCSLDGRYTVYQIETLDGSELYECTHGKTLC